MSQRVVTDHTGVAKKIACLGCDREKGLISLGDIVKSEYFDAHQDYEIPIPGFIIISSRRHIDSIDEFSTKEQQDFIKVVCSVRLAQRKILGITELYLVQEEDSSDHFHMWMFPRYAWMKAKFGTKIQSVRPIMEYARETLRTKKNIKTVQSATKKLEDFFSKNPVKA